MVELAIYNAGRKIEWDEFVSKSRNGTFLFLRDYMDYHSDRFADSSFLFFKKNKLIAVLPGNIKNGVYYSHQGLTYGGLVIDNNTGTKEVMEIFDVLNRELKEKDVTEVVYKAIPHIYHRVPSQEDVYALFRLNASKISCTVSSAIYYNNKIKFTESRKSGIRKSVNEQVSVFESSDFADFWKILDNNLMDRYNTKTTHSLDEIKLLNGRFPGKIKLIVAAKNNTIVAGTVLYLKGKVVHVQYMAASVEGKAIGALDLIFDKLINGNSINYEIFDFGHSNENGGSYLNENLIFQKEGFGGRGVVYDVYSYKLI